MISVLITILEAVFATGIVGSALVVVLTAVEDLASIREQEPNVGRERE